MSMINVDQSKNNVMNNKCTHKNIMLVNEIYFYFFMICGHFSFDAEQDGTCFWSFKSMKAKKYESKKGFTSTRMNPQPIKATSMYGDVAFTPLKQKDKECSVIINAYSLFIQL